MIKLEEMEKLLTECEEDLKKLKAFSKEFKVIEKHRKELENYYKNQYMEDYQKHSNTKEKLRILDQDSIWNVLSDQYYEKIELLKSIIKTI
jgi:hypothetical protein